MNEEQEYTCSAEYSRLEKHRILQQHPVLTPLFLLSGAVFLCIASVFVGSAFPLLNAFGVPSIPSIPSIPFCLSLALVLGTSGILISIIHGIECFDRHSFKVVLFPKSKEHTYASN